MITCFEHGGPNPFSGAKSRSLIQLDQDESGRKLFTVTYGLQRKSGLTYSQACRELGEVILHSLCCDGKASNEGA